MSEEEIFNQMKMYYLEFPEEFKIIKNKINELKKIEFK